MSVSTLSGRLRIRLKKPARSFAFFGASASPCSLPGRFIFVSRSRIWFCICCTASFARATAAIVSADALSFFFSSSSSR
jgi:hypothetical protein